MQLERTTSGLRRVTNSAIGGLLASLLIFAGVLAASPALHRALHGNLDTESQLCIAASIVQGQVHAADAPPAGALFEFTLLLPEPSPQQILHHATDFPNSPTRGPPSARLLALL